MGKKSVSRQFSEGEILEKMNQMEAFLADPRIAAMIDDATIDNINSAIASIRSEGSKALPEAQLGRLLHFLDQIAAIPAEEPVPPLFQAVAEGNVKKLKQLIKAGGDVNLPLENGKTALMVAVESAQFTVITELLKQGAIVNQRMENGFSALLLACFLGHDRVVEALIEHGATINDCYEIPSAEGAVGDNTCLTIAAHQGNLAVCKVLVAHGADLQAVTDSGYTPLMSALVNQSRTDVASFLLNSGANPDPDAVCRVAFSISTTPLILAANNGAIDVVKELIRLKVRLDRQDGGGCTALKRAVAEEHTEIVKLLIKAGAKVDTPDLEGWTALMNAADHRNLVLVKLLVKSGAAVNSRNSDGACALSLAVAARTRADDLSGLEGLLRQLSQNKEGDELQKLQGLQRQLSQSTEGETGYGELADLSLEVIEFLLIHGADPTVKLGKKLLLVAASKDEALVKLLRKHGAPARAGKTKAVVQ